MRRQALLFMLRQIKSTCYQRFPAGERKRFILPELMMPELFYPAIPGSHAGR